MTFASLLRVLSLVPSLLAELLKVTQYDSCRLRCATNIERHLRALVNMDLINSIYSIRVSCIPSEPQGDYRTREKDKGREQIEVPGETTRASSILFCCDDTCLYVRYCNSLNRGKICFCSKDRFEKRGSPEVRTSYRLATITFSSNNFSSETSLICTRVCVL